MIPIRSIDYELYNMLVQGRIPFDPTPPKPSRDVCKRSKMTRQVNANHSQCSSCIQFFHDEKRTANITCAKNDKHCKLSWRMDKMCKKCRYDAIRQIGLELFHSNLRPPHLEEIIQLRANVARQSNIISELEKKVSDLEKSISNRWRSLSSEFEQWFVFIHSIFYFQATAWLKVFLYFSNTA